MSGALRRATAVDAPILEALHGEGFAAPWRAAEFATLLAQPGVAGWLWTPEDIATPAGFILVRKAADEAEVLTLVVLPAARRKGGGRRLLAEALRSCVPVARFFLEVAADNSAAAALYRDAGFRDCGRRAAYYGTSGSDAIVMVREEVLSPTDDEDMRLAWVRFLGIFWCERNHIVSVRAHGARDIVERLRSLETHRRDRSSRHTFQKKFGFDEGQRANLARDIEKVLRLIHSIEPVATSRAVTF